MLWPPLLSRYACLNVLAFLDWRETQQSQDTVFINHICLCNTSLVPPPLCFGCVSLGYRISSNPQRVSTNKGFQRPDVVSMAVPSNITLVPQAVQVLPTTQPCTFTCRFCVLSQHWPVMSPPFRRGSQICLVVTAVTNFGFATRFLQSPSAEMWPGSVSCTEYRLTLCHCFTY